MTTALADPPEQLVGAQRATITVADELQRALRPGLSEREIASLADRLARERGATGVWTPISVGAGEGTLVCHPDHPPSDRRIGEIDLVWFDLTPEFAGWPGDYTRSVTVGSDPAREQLVADGLRLHQAIIAACRPGTPADELFGFAASLFAAEGFRLLDLLGNIGHDLGYGGSVSHSIDADTDEPMWGAWAIEPHLGRDGLGVKFEDLVWFGATGCRVLG